MSKPLLVGEANPCGADPEFALWPLPERASGHRLCTLVMGLSRVEYLRRFDRVNLCAGKWSLREARRTAGDLWQACACGHSLTNTAVRGDGGGPRAPAERGCHFDSRRGAVTGVSLAGPCGASGCPCADFSPRHPLVVLLGRKVCDAFCVPYAPFTAFRDRDRCVVLPHPSGSCRAWNEPGAYDRARAVLREAGVL